MRFPYCGVQLYLSTWEKSYCCENGAQDKDLFAAFTPKQTSKEQHIFLKESLKVAPSFYIVMGLIKDSWLWNDAQRTKYKKVYWFKRPKSVKGFNFFYQDCLKIFYKNLIFLHTKWSTGHFGVDWSKRYDISADFSADQVIRWG